MERALNTDGMGEAVAPSLDVRRCFLIGEFLVLDEKALTILAFRMSWFIGEVALTLLGFRMSWFIGEVACMIRAIAGWRMCKFVRVVGIRMRLELLLLLLLLLFLFDTALKLLRLLDTALKLLRLLGREA